MNSLARKRKRQTVAAGGLQSRQSQICLPGDLTDELPSCAFSCIQTFIHQNYTPNDCASTSDLEHLCRIHTLSGNTIGEGSLQCVASDCTDQATNQVLLAAYNICEDIDNAIPNTATVINATVNPVSTVTQTTTTDSVRLASAPTPTSTSKSTQIESAWGLVATQTSSVTISGDGVSVTVQMMMPTTYPSESPAMADVGSNFSPDEMPSMDRGLSAGAVAGAATGASLAAVLVFVLLFLFLRKRKQIKEDKTTWSKQISPPDTATSQVSTFGISPTYQPGHNKRRSFWRKSIRPDEIGVAVTNQPRARQSFVPPTVGRDQMPSSIPTRYTDVRTSWPVLAASNGAAPPRPPRESMATIFDEDLDDQASKAPEVSVDGAMFALAVPAKAKRQKTPPQPLELNRTRMISPTLDTVRSPGGSTVIPLTPTYDNGNFVVTPVRDVAPNSIAAALASTIPLATQGQIPLASPNSVASTTSPRRNRLQKKPSLKRSDPPTQPMRKDSETTFFDTDTSPEEDDKRLEAPSRGPLATIAQSPRSLISNLNYPTVPESAAVSPQARHPAEPRYLSDSPTLAFVPKGIRPQRDTLTRSRPNLIPTDSASSDGLISNVSIDWPVPPTGRPPTSQPSPISPLARLANRATMGSVYSQQRASEYQLSPNSQARITPTKSKSGDLFFKVEM